MTLTGGQKNSNAIAMENPYNTRISALRRERAGELEAPDSQYREANRLAAPYVEDSGAQYEADKARLREEYRIS